MPQVLFVLPFCLMLIFFHAAASAQPRAAALEPAREISARLDAVCGRTAEYGCYTNHRYGFVVPWPVKYLKPDGESDSGDGQTFSSGDGRSSMACWGSFHEVIGLTLKKALAATLAEPGIEVTYHRLGKDFFVVSGLRDGRIFYRKTIRSGDVEASFELVYDPALKAALDPIVKDVAGAFSIDPAFAWHSRK